MAERYKNLHDSQRKERQPTLCRDMWIRHLYRQSFPYESLYNGLSPNSSQFAVLIVQGKQLKYGDGRL